jgi:hypothetical protein
MIHWVSMLTPLVVASKVSEDASTGFEMDAIAFVFSSFWMKQPI